MPDYSALTAPDNSTIDYSSLTAPDIAASPAPSWMEQVGTAIQQANEHPLDALGNAAGKIAERLGMSPQTVARIGENVSGALQPETLMGIPGVGPIASGIEGLEGLAAERLLGGTAKEGQVARAPLASELSAVATKEPDTAAYKAESQANYRKSEALGVTVSQPSFSDMVTSMKADMSKEGYRDFRHPAAASELKVLDANIKNGAPQTFQDLDILRQAISDNKASPNPGERRIAGIMQRKIDNYMENLTPSDIVSSDPAAAPEALSTLRTAQNLWGHFRKSEQIDKLVQRAGDRAGQFSGSGYENALRTEFRQFVLNDKKMAKFSPEEQLALRRVSRGGLAANVARYVGKLAPRGIVTGVGDMVLGGMTGMGAGHLMAIGEAGRAAATALTNRNISLVRDVIRNGAQRKLSDTVSPAVLEHMQSKPATRKLTNDWLKAFDVAARYGTQGSITWLGQSSRLLATGIANELNIPQLAPRITQEIQGISPIQAQSQQNQGPGIGNQQPQ